MSNFKDLYAIDVRPHIESKGGQDYLPWSQAVKYASLADAAFTFTVHEKDDLPFFPLPTGGGFVKVSATLNGKTLSSILPVLDHRNKVIAKPNPFEINKAVQRCLCKAIALHGIGLSLWSREFIEPEVVDYTSEVEPPTGWTWETVQGHCKAEGWPAPQTLNKERLVALVTHFTDKIGAAFDDL